MRAIDPSMVQARRATPSQAARPSLLPISSTPEASMNSEWTAVEPISATGVGRPSGATSITPSSVAIHRVPSGPCTEAQTRSSSRPVPSTSKVWGAASRRAPAPRVAAQTPPSRSSKNRRTGCARRAWSRHDVPSNTRTPPLRVPSQMAPDDASSRAVGHSPARSIRSSRRMPWASAMARTMDPASKTHDTPKRSRSISGPARGTPSTSASTVSASPSSWSQSDDPSQRRLRAISGCRRWQPPGAGTRRPEASRACSPVGVTPQTSPAGSR